MDKILVLYQNRDDPQMENHVGGQAIGRAADSGRGQNDTVRVVFWDRCLEHRS
jgi:hypothetical protein